MVGESVCIVVELRRRSCLSGIAAGCLGLMMTGMRGWITRIALMQDKK